MQISWSSKSPLREQHSGWVHHHSQWIITIDWPLSKPKFNKGLHKNNKFSSGKTTIHQSLSHFPIPSSQSKTYWTLHLLFLHTIDCPHQEVTTVPSSIKNIIKTTEFRHVLSSTSQQWPWLHALWCMQGNLPMIQGGHYHYMKQLFLK